MGHPGGSSTLAERLTAPYQTGLVKYQNKNMYFLMN